MISQRIMSMSMKRDHLMMSSLKSKMLHYFWSKVRTVFQQKNIRTTLNNALLEKYEYSLDVFMRGFTMVTDGAAVMARVANASVSRDIHTPDETWMRCLAHLLNNTMKTVLLSHCKCNTLQVVAQDFRGMKRIIEDANRSGWNPLLVNDFKLKQVYETRFGTYYQVSERFLKSSHHIGGILDRLGGHEVQTAYAGLNKASNIDGTVTGYPGIEAIFDEFGIVVDCIELFEASLKPTLHIALSTVHHMMKKLDDVAKGKKVWRGEGHPLALPSIYSREICRVLHLKLLENAWDHPLLLVGCYVNAIFREM